MSIYDIFTLAFGALKDRKLRAALTIIGMMVGPGTIVALLAVSQGFTTGLTDQFSRLGADTIIVISRSGASTRLTTDTATTIQKIDHVLLAEPFQRTVVTLKVGGTTLTPQVTAINPSKLPQLIPGVKIDQGEVPEEFDLTGAIIGYNLANPTDSNQLPIKVNQVITLSTITQTFGQTVPIIQSYIVKGTFAKFGAGLLIDVDNGILIPYRAGQTLIRNTRPSGIFVVASDSASVNSVSESISDLLGKAVNVITIEQILSIITQITGSITTFLGAIAFMSVIVAFVGIMTTMFTSVSERTREIGLLKAIGFTNKKVLLTFLSEAALTGLLGGILGAALGGGLSFVIVRLLMGGFQMNAGADQSGGGTGGNGFMGEFGGGQSGQSFFNFTPLVTPELILGAIAMAVVVGVLAGLIPAWRASRLAPVEALRHE